MIGWRIFEVALGVALASLEFRAAYREGHVSYGVFGAAFLLFTAAWFLRPVALSFGAWQRALKGGLGVQALSPVESRIGPQWLHPACVLSGMAVMAVGVVTRYVFQA